MQDFSCENMGGNSIFWVGFLVVLCETLLSESALKELRPWRQEIQYDLIILFFHTLQELRLQHGCGDDCRWADFRPGVENP